VDLQDLQGLLGTLVQMDPLDQPALLVLPEKLDLLALRDHAEPKDLLVILEIMVIQELQEWMEYKGL
jgi:hypothetical protein